MDRRLSHILQLGEVSESVPREGSTQHKSVLILYSLFCMQRNKHFRSHKRYSSS